MARTKAILIDGANLHASSTQLGFVVDYAKVPEIFEGELIRAIYFTGMYPANEHSSIRPMVDWLDYHGWHVEQKPIKRYVSSEGHTKIKGNMDVEITIAALQLAEKITDLILFTGDGDFTALVKACQAKAVRVTIVSTRQTQPSMCSDELRRSADKFVDLIEIRSKIEKGPPAPIRARTGWGKRNA